MHKTSTVVMATSVGVGVCVCVCVCVRACVCARACVSIDLLIIAVCNMGLFMADVSDCNVTHVQMEISHFCLALLEQSVSGGRLQTSTRCSSHWPTTQVLSIFLFCFVFDFF